MNILFLSHCVPYPPDKGERIRAYYELKYLSQRHRIHLVCFAKTPGEERPELARALGAICASVHVVRLHKLAALYRGIAGWLGGSAASVRCYATSLARHRIQEVVASEPIDVTLAYTCPMARLAPKGIPMVLDMVDVDSAKWRAYARQRWPGWIYRREAALLEGEERIASSRASVVLVVTETERRLLRAVAPGVRAVTLANGVDVSFFDPATTPRLPALEARRYCVLTGVMNYFPNAEGAVWFAHEVFPLLREKIPALEFFIVGRWPSARVKALEKLPGVTVTGEVADVRPYLAAADFAVAPLPVARGIQNKVLEALAMGKVTLVSPAVWETFSGQAPTGVIPCASVADYVRAVDQIPAIRPEAIRSSVSEQFSWERNLARLEQLLDEVARSSREVGLPSSPPRNL